MRIHQANMSVFSHVASEKHNVILMISVHYSGVSLLILTVQPLFIPKI